MKAQERDFDLALTDGKTITMPLGRFTAVSVAEAEKKARKAYSGTFKRLKLKDWRVVEQKQ